MITKWDVVVGLHSSDEITCVAYVLDTLSHKIRERATLEDALRCAATVSKVNNAIDLLTWTTIPI